MKETIYTIPVNDAFNEICECPICLLERDLEKNSLAFILGNSCMEPETRNISNDKGFCRRHYEMLYLSRSNVLGLSLVLDTHIQHQMTLYKKMFEKNIKAIENDQKINAIANIASQVSKKNTNTGKYIDEATAFLDNLESKCEVCDRMNSTMDCYLDVIFWMYFKDKEFKEKVKTSKGFCLHHFNMIMKKSKKHLSPKQLAIFTLDINKLMFENMDRTLEDVQWFSQKFDHRNENASWKSSKDAVPRTIEKLTSYCAFDKK